MITHPYEADTVQVHQSSEAMLGQSLTALVEQFGVPLKYLAVAGFEIIMFDSGGQYLVCTCSGGSCVQARYSDTCSL